MISIDPVYSLALRPLGRSKATDLQGRSRIFDDRSVWTCPLVLPIAIGDVWACRSKRVWSVRGMRIRGRHGHACLHTHDASRAQHAQQMHMFGVRN